MNHKARVGSHLPVLMKVFNMTYGPVVELGSGVYSTGYLHWACVGQNRRMVTFEDNPEWYEVSKKFETKLHSVNFVTDWDSIDLSEPWSLAFVDPDAICGRTREKDVARLTHAEYVVCHDTENSADRKYHYSRIHELFKYRYKYDKASPYTSIFSNYHDLQDFHVDAGDVRVPKKIVPVSKEKMKENHPGSNRRYTICRAIREVYNSIEDEEMREKLRYASSLAEYVTRKVTQHDPLWLKDFYPKRRDYQKVMK